MKNARERARREYRCRTTMRGVRILHWYGQSHALRNMRAELKVGDELITAKENPQIIAEELNNYFAGAVDLVLTENNLETTNPRDTSTQHDLDNSTPCPLMSGKLCDIKLQTSNVRKAIGNLKTTISAGIDGISDRMIKELEEIVPVLTELYNKSLEEGIFSGMHEDSYYQISA